MLNSVTLAPFIGSICVAAYCFCLHLIYHKGYFKFWYFYRGGKKPVLSSHTIFQTPAVVLYYLFNLFAVVIRCERQPERVRLFAPVPQTTVACSLRFSSGFKIINCLFFFSLCAASRSYVFSSLASAAVSFATGAFGMWIPLYLARAQVVQKTAEVCTKEVCSSTDR